MNLSQAIIAYESHPTAVGESISIQSISSGTQGSYANHNVDLIILNYKREECREELLIDWMVERLLAAEDNVKKERRATFKYAVEEVNKSNNNCPIVL